MSQVCPVNGSKCRMYVVLRHSELPNSSIDIPRLKLAGAEAPKIKSKIEDRDIVFLSEIVLCKLG